MKLTGKWTKSLLMFLVLTLLAFSLIGCTQNQANDATESSQTISETTKVEDSDTSTGDGTSSEETADPGKYQFALVKGGVHPYFAPMDQAIKDVAADLNIPVPILQAPQEWNQDEQNNILDGLVAQGVAGIAMCTSDAVAGNEQISKIVEAGVPVVQFAMAVPEPSDVTFNLTTDVGESAYQGTIHLIEAMGGEGNIVHLTGNLNDSNTQLRMAAVERAASEYPGVNVLQTVTDIDVAEPAQNAISSLLTAKGKEIGGIICTAYIPTTTITTEIQKYDDLDIKIVGIDTDEIVLNGIRDGYVVGTMAQNPYGQAYLAIYSLKLLADGYTVKDDTPFVIDSGTLFINIENVDTYESDISELTIELMSTWAEKYFNAPE